MAVPPSLVSQGLLTISTMVPLLSTALMVWAKATEKAKHTITVKLIFFWIFFIFVGIVMMKKNW